MSAMEERQRKGSATNSLLGMRTVEDRMWAKIKNNMESIGMEEVKY